MKKLFFSLFFSIMTLLLLSLLTSIIIANLHYNKSIKLNYYIIQIISIILFFISGVIFGLINKKQGLLGSCLFILVYMIFVLIFDVLIKSNQLDKNYFLFVLAKCISYSFGSVLIVNIKH